MQVVDPSDQLRRLHSLGLQVEYETLLAATIHDGCGNGGTRSTVREPIDG